ncbi:hypothetical protein DSL72_007252 [Monilinia vaccinii-corymbosi]|uniref:Uncharacterized protein n=1 Tax=Monilinia vaccinii-corymbosi TaxID=61207 RepID=A0A8A3PL39_9HELO|nr:hypothetical protein DSL72_007252 [Monilinia vaccinii-corymbosi]
MFVNLSNQIEANPANMYAVLKSVFPQDQVKNLADEIGPAMRTLEHLQGSWKNMVTDLETIQQLINNDTQQIPPMILARPQLQKIVDEWNDLRQFATDYIQNSYLSESPETLSISINWKLSR